MVKKETSEFGVGLCYNLGLFIGHEFMWQKEIEKGKDEGKTLWAGMWFYGAVDHLYEIQIEQAPKKLQARLKKFRKFCFDKRTTTKKGAVKYEDIIYAVQEAKDLLRLIDKANGIKTVKGNWE